MRCAVIWPKLVFISLASVAVAGTQRRRMVEEHGCAATPCQNGGTCFNGPGFFLDLNASCSRAVLSAGIDEVDAACCAPDSPCDSLPSSCSAACAAVYLPFQIQCGAELAYSSNGPDLQKFTASCMSVATQTGFLCRCDSAWRGDVCDVSNLASCPRSSLPVLASAPPSGPQGTWASSSVTPSDSFIASGDTMHANCGNSRASVPANASVLCIDGSWQLQASGVATDSVHCRVLAPCAANDLPSVDSGTWSTPIHGSSASYSSGQTVTLVCEPGYQLSDPSSEFLICTDGTFSGPGLRAHCVSATAGNSGASCLPSQLPPIPSGTWLPPDHNPLGFTSPVASGEIVAAMCSSDCHMEPPNAALTCIDGSFTGSGLHVRCARGS